MSHPKFQLYKHIKINSKWRYCRAAIYSNGKVKLHVVVVCGQEEKLLLHPPQKVLDRSRYRSARRAADAQQAR
jgi:hypothetical protein